MKCNKKLKLVVKILFYVVFAAVLVLVVGMLISKMTNQVFFVGDRAAIWVVTDSMEDQIPAQSYIQIRKVDPSQIEVDNVITFYSDDPTLQGNLNTHRVVEVSEDGRTFVTKGDNNLGNDQYPVRAESVVGVYEKNLTVLTFFGRLMQTKVGLLCVLILIAVLTVFSFYGDSIKKLLGKTDNGLPSDEIK